MGILLWCIKKDVSSLDKPLHYAGAETQAAAADMWRVYGVYLGGAKFSPEVQ
jgi:hypothetical protein